ncbi:MAG: FHA domain-containing protein, partial [Cyanobacteria bacterium P01_H01_bin.15]
MGESKSFRHLLVIEEPNQETRTIVLEENTYSLGRSLSNSITLLSRMVSRHHATLLRVHYADQPQDVFWVIDGDLQGNRSANGVFVNGKRCLSYELESEDAIFFGSEVKATFKVVNSAYITLTNTLAQHTQDQGHHKDPRQLAPEDEFDQNVTRIPHGVLQPLDNLNPEILCLLTNQPDSLSEPVMEMDFAGNFTFVNAAAEKRFPDLNRLQKNHPALAG